MKFSSRKDIWMFILVAGLFVVFARLPYQSLTGEWKTTDVIIGSIMIVFLLLLWFNTRYKIEHQQLIIYFGPIKQVIPVKDVVAVAKVTTPMLGAALSRHRLELFLKGDRAVQISPKDQEAFMTAIRSIQPNVRQLY